MRGLRFVVEPRIALVRLVVLVVLAACTGAAAANDAPGRGEQVIFARSIASMSADGEWALIVQGRIFEPAEDSHRRRALVDLLAPALGADRHDPIFRSRAGHFVSDSISDGRVSVLLGEQSVQLSPSNAAGYFSGEIALTDAQAQALSRDGVISFESSPTFGNATRFQAAAVLVPRDALIVVTDMDDTIKDTHILDHSEAKANTFVRPFRAVAGMPELYRAWKEAMGSRVHFHVVSAGPWQFHEPLRRFTEEAGYPAFTWDMRSLDITDPRVLADEVLKADPDRLLAFKLMKIRALMDRFPAAHVVLVGDSGERDPEVYAAVAGEFADRVDAVFIRNVRAGDEDLLRCERLFAAPALAAKLRVFIDPADLPRQPGTPR